jgi:predicted NUDIX family phosphoesterase
MLKHQEHIVCVKSSIVAHHQDGFVEYDLKLEDIMLGQRAVLEQDYDFRQVLPVSIFTHNNKVWAYERTSKGGESRLHNKIAVAVGGHWDMADLALKDGVIDLEESLSSAMQRELEEEVNLRSNVLSTKVLRNKICCSETDVDKVHMAIVYLHELDGELIESAEDQLKNVGFIAPAELLNGDYNLETWARIVCEILVKES